MHTPLQTSATDCQPKGADYANAAVISLLYDLATYYGIYSALLLATKYGEPQ